MKDETPERAQTVSVILCAYTEERWDALVEAITSVQRQTRQADEIIVVIDHNERLIERIREHFPHIRLTHNIGMQGHSGAMNTGAMLSRGSILAFLDDDAAAEPEWLATLLISYRSSDVLGVGGFIAPQWLVGRPRWFPEEFYWVVGCSYRGLPATTAPIRNPIGANFSIRREVYEAVGGVRDDFARVGTRPFSCNETDLCIRAAQIFPRGVFVYEPRARVHHRVPANRVTFRYFRSHCYDEGQAKALLSRLVGARDGLASERAYALRRLPEGIIHGLADAIQRGDPAGILRAGAIVFGLGAAATGYLSGTFSLHTRRVGFVVRHPGRRRDGTTSPNVSPEGR